MFQEADPNITDNQLLWRMFNAANVAVYDTGMARGGADRMATTLTAALFRRNEVAIGHVGDSRAYLVRQGTIKQLTSDHTYVAMQVKMSLISKQDAMNSELRGLLTRSIGANPTVQVDYARAVLRKACAKAAIARATPARKTPQENPEEASVAVRGTSGIRKEPTTIAPPAT